MYKLYDILNEAEISDAENIKIIAAKYPQYNFDKATIFTKKISDKTKTSGYKNVKYLNGLFCPKIDPITGKPHGYSDGLKVANLKSPEGIIGCRICSKNYIDIEKEIKNFRYPEKGYIFDPKNFYRKKVGKDEDETWYVKNILCTKHNKPLLFAQDGIAWYNINRDKGGCPICEPIKSRGNNEVYRVLEKLGYNDYKKEKTFPGANGCYGFKGQDYCDLLRYDAYVEKDGKPICIEYDGEQHFFPIPHFGGEEGLKARKELDQRKTEYCENNGIRLIRIPYTKYNKIGDILKEEIGPNDKISEAQRLQKLAGISEIKIEPQVFEPIKGYEDEFEKAGFYFDEGILGGVGSGAHGYYDAVSDRISGRYLNEFNEDEFDKWYDNFNINDVKSFTYPNKESVEANTSINMDQLLSTLEPGMYDLGERLGYIKLGKNGSITKYAMPSLVSDDGDNYMRMFRLDSLGRVRPKMDKEKIKNILQKNLQDPGDWFIL